MAVESDEPIIGNSEVKKLEDRVRELELHSRRQDAGARDSSRSPYRRRSALRNRLPPSFTFRDIRFLPIHYVFGQSD